MLEAPNYPAELSPLPEDILLQPEWLLQPANLTSETGNLLSQASSYFQASSERLIRPGHVTPSCIHGTETSGSTFSPTGDLLPIPGSLTVTIEQNERVTPSHHWQDVRSITLSSPLPVHYRPGDVLTIFPKNFPEEVEQMIKLMNWNDVADRPIRFMPTTALTDLSPGQPPIPHLLPLPWFTLRSLLINHLDLNSIPRRSFFSLIAHFTDDPDHKERLQEFTKPQFLDELYDYTTRPRRSILEVLQEFHSVKVPWQWAARLIPDLKGRQFSIASGGPKKLMGPEDRRGRFDLLVAIVNYRTVIRRLRQGTCTRYLAALPIGSKINVLLLKGSLNISRADLSKPVIMVAPGTGIAPMRAMLWERLSCVQEPHQPQDGKMPNGYPSQGYNGMAVLFFGCRNQEADYFYTDEWNGLRAQMDLEVYAAFSRDQVSCTRGSLHHRSIPANLILDAHIGCSVKRSTCKILSVNKRQWCISCYMISPDWFSFAGKKTIELELDPSLLSCVPPMLIICPTVAPRVRCRKRSEKH